MTPVGEVIATANGLGEFKDRGEAVAYYQTKKGTFFLFWKYNAEHEIREKASI